MIKKYITSALVGLGITQMHFHSNQLAAEETFYEPSCCIVGHDPIDPCCVNGGYPLPAAIAPECRWDFYVKGSFLYWSQLDPIFGNIAKRIDTLNGATTTNLYLNHRYRPGFRVSIGSEVNGVVLDATYIRFHAHYSSHFTTGANQAIQPVALPLVTLFGVNFSEYQPDAHLNLDSVFLSAQKPVYTGKALIVNLSYALALFWQHQKYVIDAITSAPLPAVNGVIVTNHKAFVAGPDLGVRATALLPWGFELVAQIDLAGGVGYQYKGISTASFPGALLPSGLTTRGHFMHFHAYHNGEIGLGWSDYVWCDRYRINLEVTYNFFTQHIFYFGTFEGQPISSYSIHGWAFGGRLDF
jgi:hypothetical protein